MYRMSQKGSVQYLETEAFAALDGVTHAFCTRNSGVSAGPYASLNTGFLSGDRKEDVYRNLALIGEAFAISRGSLVLMGQVHGDRIAVIDGNGSLPEFVPECDGMITSRPEVALGIRTADCVPLLFADPLRRVIGVAHAGWRGTASRIASRMVDLFEERFSSRREDLLVAVGPAIGGCCYQVDAPVYDAFARFQGAERFLRPCPEKGRWMLDLASANGSELRERGIPAEHINLAGYCTACRNELFFSHRAHQGRTGRQINFLMLHQDLDRVAGMCRKNA